MNAMSEPTVDVLNQLKATRVELCAALKRDDITYEQIDRLPAVQRLDAVIAAVAELIEENKRLKVKANNWDLMVAARNQAAEAPESAHWKQVAREQGVLYGTKACRAELGVSLREARECVEDYMVSIRPGRVGGAE